MGIKIANPRPSVSTFAGASESGISRRQALNAIIAIAAIPLTALPNIVFAAEPDRAAWDRALASAARIEAEYAQVTSKHSAAFCRRKCSLSP
jgi:hypothetical protein